MPFLSYNVCFTPQDLAASMDEEDVLKFTEAIKEFDSMTRLVCLPSVSIFMLYFERKVVPSL